MAVLGPIMSNYYHFLTELVARLVAACTHSSLSCHRLLLTVQFRDRGVIPANMTWLVPAKVVTAELALSE